MVNQLITGNPSISIIGRTKCILIVEEDQETINILTKFCKAENFHVVASRNGLRGLTRFQMERPDFVLLDWNLPGLSGFEVCRRIRTVSDVPIFILSASDNEEVKLRAFEMGADDFLTRPVSPREVIARIKINLRRLEKTGNFYPFQGYREHGLTESNLISSGSLIIDKQSRYALYNGQAIKALTNKEFELLVIFVCGLGQVFSIAELETALYNCDEIIGSRAIVAHISNLRAKLPNPNIIETVRGVGYKLSIAAKPTSSGSGPG